MSLDPSLKTGGSLAGHRNVLTRAERIAKLKANGEFKDDSNALGLRKVGNRKVLAGGKAKKKKEATE
jgi:small basic protein (TIGR04137 family)